MRIARSGSHSKALEHGRYARTNHIQRLVKAGNPDGGTLALEITTRWESHSHECR
jgi:hypothetical protein